MAIQIAEHDELRTVTVERRNDAGDVLGTVELASEVFGRSPNVPLMHQVVTAQLAARRAGTQSTKTRAEVRGGGAKPYRQKGTGRARQGTIRAPQYGGGGIALGPKPRSYKQHTPRKMTRLALNGALSDRAAESRVCLIDGWSFDFPKTKDAIAAIGALGLEGNILVVLGPEDEAAERSFANLPEVDLVETSQLTAYDVLVNDWIVFTDASVPGEVKEVAGASKPRKRAAKSSSPAAGEGADADADDSPAEAATAARDTEDTVEAQAPDASDEGATDESAEAGLGEDEAAASAAEDSAEAPAAADFSAADDEDGEDGE